MANWLKLENRGRLVVMRTQNTNRVKTVYLIFLTCGLIFSLIAQPFLIRFFIKKYVIIVENVELVIGTIYRVI